MSLALVLFIVSACGSTGAQNSDAGQTPGALCEMIYTPGIDLHVTLASGLSASEVQVTVTGGASAQTLSEQSESNGTLNFFGVNQPGTYQVTVSYPGETSKVLSNIQVTSNGCQVSPQSLSVSLP
jgi:hypothetical protein